MEPEIRKKLIQNGAWSLLFYATPVLLMIGYFAIVGEKPWEQPLPDPMFRKGNTESLRGFVILVFENLRTWGLTVLILIWSMAELLLGLFGHKWSKNDKLTDLASLILPRFTFAPLVTYFSLQILPVILPGWANAFAWVPFWWGVGS